MVTIAMTLTITGFNYIRLFLYEYHDMNEYGRLGYAIDDPQKQRCSFEWLTDHNGYCLRSYKMMTMIEESDNYF